MSLRTTIFNLYKLLKGEEYDIAQFNANMDIIDEEMAKPPLTVNGIEPDPVTRDIQVTTVPLADNLTTEEAQINTGTYVIRTSGGEASIADGGAWLSDVKGNMIKTGYVPESLQMTVTLADPTAEDPISASIDRDTFVEQVTSSSTITLTYSTAWSADPSTYGITVTGTPAAGDQIVVVYVKENRGTITTATPTSFVSTGWNLYNHAAGYARVVNYSQEYGFMIEGTYTGLKFAATLDGEQTTITPTDGYFTVPSDGYVFVTGGNSTDTEIWMTWSDWTEEANSGVFAAYTSESIDLSGVMVDFPAGLMKIGNYYDEINLNTGKAYSRIERMEYTDENLEAVIASGVPYDTDTDYIYAVRSEPVVYTISLNGEYTVSDHGEEMFLGTSVPLTASSLYGNDLKGKLRRDVVTISQQTLTSTQQAQVRTNIGAASQADVTALNGNLHPTAELSSISEIVTLLEKPENNGYALFRVTDALNNSLTGVLKSATVLAFKTSSVSDYIEFLSLDYDGDVRTGSYKISTGAISTVCQASIHIGSVTGTTSSSGNVSTTFSKYAVILSAWSSSGGCVITPYPGSGADDSGQYTWWFHVCSDAADNHVIANTSLTVYYTYMLVNG